jgi:hypothetical protein
MFDKWNDRHPKVGELDEHELNLFLLIVEDSDYFTNGEKQFCRSCQIKLQYGGSLSDGQKTVLNRELLKKLWGQDPQNWRMD